MKIKLLTLFAILGLGSMNFVACSSGESEEDLGPPEPETPEEEGDIGGEWSNRSLSKLTKNRVLKHPVFC